MLWYFAQMAVLLPLLALLIWGSLKLTRLAQDRLGAPGGDTRAIRLVETTFLGPGTRLAVVEFRGRQILLGCTRQGLTRLSEVPAESSGQHQP